jgi:hypothetical protein
MPTYQIPRKKFDYHPKGRGALVTQSVQCLTTQWMAGVRSPAKAKDLSRPALRPTKPPIQSQPGDQFPGIKRGRDVTLTTHLHLVSRSRMSKRYTSFLLSTCMANSGQLYFTFTLKEEEVLVDHQRDGNTNSPNWEIETGQKASTL